MSEDTPERGSSEDRTTRPLGSQPGPPTRIGRYRVLQKIGEGGMGEVYLAEQDDPRRKVALKIIKWGMDTTGVIARFEAERQALALMDHPNIAKVFDAGATEQGRPFFVMEYVKGVPLTEHCDTQRLTTRERLELFIKVCEGVQHAHQKAVIHRDLKPSNILVVMRDGKAVPKIIDFGVAKAIEHRLTEQTLFTRHGAPVGTPAYMSPEQAENTQDIDTRTDVYSLGVVLYELFVGVLPFDPRELRSAAYEEIRRRIREDEPSKPSTRVPTLDERSLESAKKRRSDPRSLARELRGDLDWITMMALEKDRTRRYASPNELAADIIRYLRHEAVTAGPPSVAYRAWKFARRHRFGVAATSLALVVVLAFASTTWVQSRRIAREAETAERVSEFLADMLGTIDPHVLGFALWKDLRERTAEARRRNGATEQEIEAVLAALGDALSGTNPTDAALRLVDQQILFRAGQTIENELTEDPRIAGRLHYTIGQTYQKLGLYEQAERHANRAAVIRERAFGPKHVDTLRSKAQLCRVYKRQGRYAESEPLCLETLETRKRVLGDDHAETLVSVTMLANLYEVQGRYDEAVQLHLETLERLRRRQRDDDPHSLLAMNNLANLYAAQGRYAEAEPLYLETLESRRRLLGDDHSQTLASMNNLGALYSRQGRYDRAETLYREALETRRRALGDDHPLTLSSMGNMALLYRDQGRYAEAEPLNLSTLETQRRVLGDVHPETLASLSALADLYSDQGRYAEAEPLYLTAVEKRKRVLPDDHPDTLRSINSLANLYMSQGRYADAEPLQLEAVEGHKRRLGDDHPHTLRAVIGLGNLYQNQGRLDEAESLYLEALEIQDRVLGDDHPETLGCMNNLANLYLEQDRYDEAESLYLQTLETQKPVLGVDHPETLRSMNNLAALYTDQGRYEEAEPLYLAALEAQQRVLGADHPETATTLHNLACLYRETDRYAKSRSFFERTLEIDEQALGPDHPYVAEDLVEYAKLLRKLGEIEEATELEARATTIREKLAN